MLAEGISAEFQIDLQLFGPFLLALECFSVIPLCSITLGGDASGGTGVLWKREFRCLL